MSADRSHIDPELRKISSFGVKQSPGGVIPTEKRWKMYGHERSPGPAHYYA